MRAGSLRDRVTIQSQATSSDGQGGKTKGSWSAVTGMERIPADVQPMSGSEQIAAGQVQSGVTHTVTLRYRTGVKADMRAVWHARGGNRNLYLTGAPVIVDDYDGLMFSAREKAD